MIKNEKQYKITKKKLQEFNAAILKKQTGQDLLSVQDKLVLVSLQVMREQFDNEIAAYEYLKTNMSSLLNERSIDELPELLIEYKVQAGLTQKEFSKKIQDE